MSKLKRLLIVDDSKVSRMLVINFIRALRPDWVCSEAGNGAEALQLALASSFDYATLDMNMPGMDGLELATRFRTECPGMKVCLLTANIQEDIQNRAKSLNVGFVEKPPSMISVEKVISYFEVQP